MRNVLGIVLGLVLTVGCATAPPAPPAGHRFGAVIGTKVIGLPGTPSGTMFGSNNLSEVTSAATARTNLGLGTASTQSSSAFLQASNNLSDLGTPATARTNLGLGKGADVASAGTIAPVNTAEFFHITGTTAIDFITNTGFEDGAHVCFYFVSAITLNNNTGSPPGTGYALQLIGGANASLAAGAKNCFRRDTALTKWVETERTAP